MSIITQCLAYRWPLNFLHASVLWEFKIKFCTVHFLQPSSLWLWQGPFKYETQWRPFCTSFAVCLYQLTVIPIQIILKQNEQPNWNCQFECLQLSKNQKAANNWDSRTQRNCDKTFWSESRYCEVLKLITCLENMLSNQKYTLFLS